MTESLFRRAVVPVANRTDAEATAAALAPYVSADDLVVAVHVDDDSELTAEEAAAPDRTAFTQAIFDRVVEGLAESGAEVETRRLSGSDVAASVIDAAHELDATAIAFTPRGGSRWMKILTGDVTTELVAESDVPVVVLPD